MRTIIDPSPPHRVAEHIVIAVIFITEDWIAGMLCASRRIAEVARTGVVIGELGL